MKKGIKQLLTISLIILAIVAITIPVKAVTNNLNENVESSSNKDTYKLADGTIVIGKSKFTPGVIVTGEKAAIAGANDLAIYVAKNKTTKNYPYPKMYTYTFGEWYEYVNGRATKKVSPTLPMEIWYVDNVLKQGQQAPELEKPAEPVTKYNVFFVSGEESKILANKEVVENEKVGEVEGLQEALQKRESEGYRLTGWLKAEKDKAPVQVSIADLPNEVISSDTLYIAQWKLLPTVSTTMTKTAKVDQETTEYSVKIDNANDYANKAVYAIFTINKVTSNGEVDASSLVNLSYTTADFFTKEQGFTLTTGAEGKFKATFKEKGTYNVVIEIRDKETDEVLGKTEVINVEVAPAEVDADTIVNALKTSFNEDLADTYEVAVEGSVITVTTKKAKLTESPADSFNTILAEVKEQLASVKDYIDTVTIIYTDAEGQKTINSLSELVAFMTGIQNNKALVEIGQFDITIQLKENCAVFEGESSTTKQYTLNVEAEKEEINSENVLGKLTSLNQENTIKEVYKYETTGDNITVTVQKGKVDEDIKDVLNAIVEKVRTDLSAEMSYIKSATIEYTDTEGNPQKISSMSELLNWINEISTNREILEIGKFKITVNLDEKYAEFAESEGATSKEFNVTVNFNKEEINPENIFTELEKLNSTTLNGTYTLSHESEDVTVKISTNKLSDALDDDIITAIANKIKELDVYQYIDSAVITSTNVKDAEGNDLKVENWTELLAWVGTIKSNRDLIGAEFKVTINLDDVVAEYAGDNTASKDFTLTVTADKENINVDAVVTNLLNDNKLNETMFEVKQNGSDNKDILVTVKEGGKSTNITPGSGTGIVDTLNYVLKQHYGIESVTITYKDLTFTYDRNTTTKNISEWLTANLQALLDAEITDFESLIGKTIKVTVNLNEMLATNSTPSAGALSETYDLTFQSEEAELVTERELSATMTGAAEAVKKYNVSIEEDVIHINFTADQASWDGMAIVGGSGLFDSFNKFFENTDVKSITIGGQEIDQAKVKEAQAGGKLKQFAFASQVAQSLGITTDLMSATNATMAAEVAKLEHPVQVTLNLKEGHEFAESANNVYTIDFSQATDE